VVHRRWHEPAISKPLLMRTEIGFVIKLGSFRGRAWNRLLLPAAALPLWLGGQSNLDQAANCL
jgi:hypothetical protein